MSFFSVLLLLVIFVFLAFQVKGLVCDIVKRKKNKKNNEEQPKEETKDEH